MTSTPLPFLEAINAGPLVADGAIGTQLYQRGVFVNRSFEEVCLSNPNLVRRIHEDYVAAGANLIQTHTFAANRIKLGKHGLEDRTVAINAAAVSIARDAAANRAYVAGAVGPTGMTPGVISDRELEKVKDAYKEQLETMAESGVDVIVLETFRLVSELRIALEIAKKYTNIPVIAQAAFDVDGRTGDGADPKRVVMLLKDAGADVVGANCIEGPKHNFTVVEQMVGMDIPISVMPNAGYPRRQDHRMIYMATPEYFGVYARRFFKIGVSMVGGCCGTGPEHVVKIAAAAKMMGGGVAGPNIEITGRSYEPLATEPVNDGPFPTVPSEDKTSFAHKIWDIYNTRVTATDPVPLSPETFAVSVEVNPPPGLNPQKALAAAKMLIDHGVDVINIADGPRASVRMSNQALALLIDKHLHNETILHVCCRDRNLLGLQSDLLANHVLGLHNLVVITGDPPKMGDYPHATAVFDLDSIGLLRMVSRLNTGLDPAGRPMNEATRFFCACGAEPAALDYDREIRRLEMKKAAGAEFVMTQPVYDPVVLERFLKDTAHLGMPILVGLLPLASFRNAEFLHNEVPGMQIPAGIRQRMEQFDRGPRARAEGVKIAQEALMAVSDKVVGAYIMPPFGRYVAALEVLQCIGYEVPEEG